MSSMQKMSEDTMTLMKMTKAESRGRMKLQMKMKVVKVKVRTMTTRIPRSRRNLLYASELNLVPLGSRSIQNHFVKPIQDISSTFRTSILTQTTIQHL